MYQEISLSPKAQKILKKIMVENPKLEKILQSSSHTDIVLEKIKKWVKPIVKENPLAYSFYKRKKHRRKDFELLYWRDYAAIRILDYIDNADRDFIDLNRHGEFVKTSPFKLLWLAYRNKTGGATTNFFVDMLQLFRQFEGKCNRMLPSKEKILEWMDRYPSGLDNRVIEIREKNKARILNIILKKLDSGELKSNKYKFTEEKTVNEKMKTLRRWWSESKFHLAFAVRSPDDLNEMLGYSIDTDTMNILYEAKKKGIPFFVNPYYLSLLNVKNTPEFAIGGDTAIRDYVIYSSNLVKEFGHIIAWEKEDIVKSGEPNAAGWLLPDYDNIHRRYPNVAILIPDTVGRACAGLCSSCQRMYGFQKGNFNFNLKKLMPKTTWNEKLEKLLKYFEDDSQLKDILITGGDALMSSDKSLEYILERVYEMAKRKIENNKKKKPGEKYAEIVRVRLGTRLPVYLPQRITSELIKIIYDFKKKASKIGIKQFVIQTHFQSPMEVTPEVEVAIKKIISSGWLITNQLVFTVAASRRGHTAKLRKVLNDIGVLPYYTFSVKGYMENNYNFATNARAVQEQLEEKILGKISKEHYRTIKYLYLDAKNIVKSLNKMRKLEHVPFLDTDRNVLNMPGVGKSLSFRVIGITRQGRRILEFDYDYTRTHSPIINKKDRIIIVESKAIREYLLQLENMMGEDRSEYSSIYGYSMGETEPVSLIYKYPEYDFEVTDKITNFKLN
jgi:lysine 2,3-aminomutase